MKRTESIDMVKYILGWVKPTKPEEQRFIRIFDSKYKLLGIYNIHEPRERWYNRLLEYKQGGARVEYKECGHVDVHLPLEKVL